MSKYTVELRQIINRTNIFDFNYKFVDDNTKKLLEKMFIDHYYFKEIGFETISRFKHYLKNVFNEKLEYYEMLIITSKIDYDILNNYDLKENYTKNTVVNNTTNYTSNNNINSENKSVTKNNTSNTSTNTLENSNNEINKFSDTPQSNILLDDNYITNVTKNDKTSNELNNFSSTENNSSETTDNTKNTNSTTSKNLSDGSQNENYELTRKGNIGVMTPTDMLEKHIEYKKKVTNIINKFFENECNCLFMQIY